MGRFVPDARRLLTILLAGCGDTQAPFDTRSGADDENGPAGYTTPAELIEAFAEAMTERNLDDYIALLEPWDREEEIGMIAHRSDDAFVSQETGQSIVSITAEVTSIRSVRENSLLARDETDAESRSLSLIKALYRSEAP